MKKINNVLAVVATACFLIFSTDVFSQTNHSQVYTFMKSIGWELTSDNKFGHPKAGEYTTTKYYQFTAGTKYAIVAFSRSKDVQDIELDVEYVNGEIYRRNNDTQLMSSFFHLDFSFTIVTFVPTEDFKLGVKINLDSTHDNQSSEFHYMIFAKNRPS